MSVAKKSYAVNRAFRALRGISNEDAAAAGEVIAAIARRSDNTVTPKLLLEESRPANAPLHHMFEWNDAIAGEKFREQQAAYILRAIVEPMEVDGKPTEVRAFISLPIDSHSSEADPRQREYRETMRVLNDKELRAHLLKQALEDLKAWENRYRMLKELAVVRLAAARLYSKYEE